MNLISILLFFGVLIITTRYVEDSMVCYLIGYTTCRVIIWVERKSNQEG